MLVIFLLNGRHNPEGFHRFSLGPFLLDPTINQAIQCKAFHSSRKVCDGLCLGVKIQVTLTGTVCSGLQKVAILLFQFTPI